MRIEMEDEFHKVTIELKGADSALPDAIKACAGALHCLTYSPKGIYQSMFDVADEMLDVFGERE